MNSPHILSAFDRDLEALQGQLMRMGGLVEAALMDAAEALDTRDADLAMRVRAGDAAIDALEEQVNTGCARLLALRGPTAGDLRTILSVMKIAAALERAGDYAKNLAKRSAILSGLPPVSGATGSIRRLAKAAVQMLADALNAYIRRDLKLAEDVRRRDRDIDQMYNSIFREFLTHMMEDPRNIGPCMHLHFIAKNIERVGDHATTMAEQVIYLVTGAMPAEDRPKFDATTGQAGG
ncbi:MAG: phosphate signaling complex protein PhoU [Tabrizicola sp.]|nr:phosphate signaling complex protein PhoU [Tabrizicola sp.]